MMQARYHCDEGRTPKQEHMSSRKFRYLRHKPREQCEERQFRAMEMIDVQGFRWKSSETTQRKSCLTATPLANPNEVVPDLGQG